ncbi:MAG: L-aspartate oxidase [Rhodospirillaceae bacterium]|nr:L-aspartate oxidase [Rhodospirillaceae bacterium]
MTPEDRVIVVGSGIAGLATALELRPLPVLLVTGGALEAPGSTVWAQGWIAAAIGDDDEPALHAADTLAAGAGLSDRDIAVRVAAQAPERIARLIEWGVPFDRDADGVLARGTEAAHSRARILHAGGDRSGAAILKALADVVRATPSITIMEHAVAEDLLGTGRVTGVRVRRGREVFSVHGRAVVLATGGAGALYAATTNPPSSWGAGLAMAARAGAVMRDLEFVQFHPTAIDLMVDPLPLASEAIRGEGVPLIDDRGAPVMAGIAGGDLAPRDVVARAVFQAIAGGRTVLLDTPRAMGGRFAKRFPGIDARCKAAGLVPASLPIPVRPAAHYHMGGIRVDGRGRSSLPGLWACGEVAATGLHGGNRLASNSLLEAVTFSAWIADDIKGEAVPALEPAVGPQSAPSVGLSDADKVGLSDLRRLMERDVGVVRDGEGLARAVATLSGLVRRSGTSERLRRQAQVSLMIALAALHRTESCGAHSRRDAPRAPSSPPRHQDITLVEAETAAASFAEGNREETCL